MEDVAVTVKEPLKILVTGASRLTAEAVAKALTSCGFDVECVLVDEIDASDAPFPVQIVFIAADIERTQLTAAIRRIKRKIPDGKIVLVGTQHSESDIVDFIGAGALGFVQEDQAFQDLLDTIEAVQAEKSQCSPRLIAQVFTKIGDMSRRNPPAYPSCDLTEREKQVLQLLAAGRSNKEIGQHLSISVSTVKNHVHHILEKLRLRTRREAIAWVDSRPFNAPLALVRPRSTGTRLNQSEHI